jgi:hypothetical protein
MPFRQFLEKYRRLAYNLFQPTAATRTEPYCNNCRDIDLYVNRNRYPFAFIRESYAARLKYKTDGPISRSTRKNCNSALAGLRKQALKARATIHFGVPLFEKVIHLSGSWRQNSDFWGY